MNPSPKQSPEDILRETITDIQGEHPISERLSWLGYFVIIFLAGIALGIGGERSGLWSFPSQNPQQFTRSDVAYTSDVVQLKSNTEFVRISSDTDGRNDLYKCSRTALDNCWNLTNTPQITETYPVLNLRGDTLIYYGLSRTDGDLYLLPVVGGIAANLTQQAGTSGLHTSYVITPALAPLFSPSGQQIVFPAQKLDSNSIELYIVKTDGTGLKRLTDRQMQVRDYIWLDDESLIVTATDSNNTRHDWLVEIQTGQIIIQPFK